MSMISHRISCCWFNCRIDTLDDLIPPNPKLIFVGINPSIISVKKGHYHQGRLGKRFWKRLNDYSIVHLENGFEDDQLLSQGFGITDLVKLPTARGHQLRKEDFVLGHKLLQKKLAKWNPKLVCFIYKTAAQEMLGIKLTKRSGFLKGLEIGRSWCS